MTFQSNPLNGDLIGIKNENAIARSVRNIVFTLPGEKPFDPTFGSRINRTLFENLDNISASQIVSEIEQSIKNYEPRVELIDVIADPNYDNNSFDVDMTYVIVGSNDPPTAVQLVLNRTR